LPVESILKENAPRRRLAVPKSDALALVLKGKVLDSATRELYSFYVELSGSFYFNSLSISLRLGERIGLRFQLRPNEMDDLFLKRVLFEWLRDRSRWVVTESEDQRKKRRMPKSYL